MPTAMFSAIATGIANFIAPGRSETAQVISSVRAQNLSYCGPPKLETIAEAVRVIERQRVPGIFLEAGVALGGSAIVIARLKSPERPLALYDVFGLIPPPSDRDEDDAHERYRQIASGTSAGIGGNKYYGYEDDLFAKVRHNLESNGVDLARDRVTMIQGLFENTLDVNGPVAFAHIDCDWYDSVNVCLDRIAPNVSPGGIMIFDDYGSYSGCRKAVDEFLSRGHGFEVVSIQRSITLRKTA